MRYSDSSPPSWPWGCPRGEEELSDCKQLLKSRLCVPPSLWKYKIFWYNLSCNKPIHIFCFMCPYSIIYELFICPFSFAFNFKVDGFIFCLLLFSAVFCLCQLLVNVSDTSYPLFSNGVNQGNGDEPVSPQWKEVTVRNTAQLCISCTLHTNTFGSLTCSERVCARQSQGGTIIAVLFPPELSCTWVTCCTLFLWCIVSL